MNKKLINLLPWFAFLVLFFCVWFYLITSQNLKQDVLQYWPMSVAMLFGSYAAGSTPMGGGTVGFPILVYVFDYPAGLGRDFSFAVQSIGMVSASIFILCKRQHINWPVLNGAICGALLGLPMGMLFFAPFVNSLLATYIFAVMWAAFGVLHLYKLNDICGQKHQQPTNHSVKSRVILGLTVGLLSSICVVSVTGVGIDMLIYIVLILFFKNDLKTAIPTSVIIMAFTSVLGIAYQSIFSTLSAQLYLNWLAAAPIVIFGAPLGVIAVNKIGRKITLFIVAILCVVQFLYIVLTEYNRLSIGLFSIALLSIVILVALFEGVNRLGQHYQNH